MNADSAIDVLSQMKNELKELRTITGSESVLLATAKHDLVAAFAQLSSLLSTLVGENELAEKVMSSANNTFDVIEKQDNELRDLRNKTSQDMAYWGETSRHISDTISGLWQLSDRVDSSLAEVWDSINQQRDIRLVEITSRGDDISIEDLFARERESFDRVCVEVERKSERLIADSLRIDIRSRLETQTDKMFDELEEWRREHLVVKGPSVRKRREVSLALIRDDQR